MLSLVFDGNVWDQYTVDNVWWHTINPVVTLDGQRVSDGFFSMQRVCTVSDSSYNTTDSLLIIQYTSRQASWLSACSESTDLAYVGTFAHYTIACNVHILAVTSVHRSTHTLLSMLVAGYNALN